MSSARATALVVLIASSVATAALLAAPPQAATTAAYFPARGEWRKAEPAAAGFDKAKLDEAVAFAVAHENPDTKDLAVAIPNQFRAEAPYNALIGPTQPRGAANGLIVSFRRSGSSWRSRRGRPMPATASATGS